MRTIVEDSEKENEQHVPDRCKLLHRRRVLRDLFAGVTVISAGPGLTAGCAFFTGIGRTLLAGRVIDFNGQPLPGATVNYAAQSQATDSLGRYEFEADPTATRVEASGVGLIGFQTLAPTGAGPQLTVPDIALYPDDLSIGIDVTGDGVSDNLADHGPRLVGPVVELTPAEETAFLASTPAFGQLKDFLQNTRGFTNVDPLVYLDVTNQVGQSLTTPGGKQVTILSLPSNTQTGFAGGVLAAGLSDAGDTIEFFDQQGTLYVLSDSTISFMDPALGIIPLDEIDAGSPTTLRTGQQQDELTPRQRAFAKWLKEEEGLSATWLKLIVAGYITLIFSPIGWVACFAMLWIVGDAIENCLEATKE